MPPWRPCYCCSSASAPLPPPTPNPPPPTPAPPAGGDPPFGLLPPDAQAQPGETRAREEQRALLLLNLLHSKLDMPAGHSSGAGVGNGAGGGVGTWGVGVGNGALDGAFPHLASPSLALQAGAAADRCSPDVHEAASGHDGRGGRGAPEGGWAPAAVPC